MKQFIKLFVLAMACNLSQSAAQQDATPLTEKPKLMVGIIVDQMRWDYIYKYSKRYGEGGFKRMLNEGFSSENTLIDYLPTKTAIGHSTVFTGSVPAIHGITGNDYIDQKTGLKMYCAADPNESTVGSSSKAGQMSPRNLLTSTIGDQLKLATNFRSKVIGVSIKDRGAIFPAGHTANAAYWFDDLTGNWISSTYYMKTLPQWVEKINQSKAVENFIKKDWNTLYPIESYIQSTADDTAYEKLFKGATKTTFPVKTSEMFKENSFSMVRYTPYGNTHTLNLAMAAIQNEQMGSDEDTDFLTVSLSSTDLIGHQFGVNSIEVEDTYLRLDKDLEQFFKYLDKQVGKNQYTVFLTADHGGGENVQFLKDQKMPADIWDATKYLNAANASLKSKYGFDQIIGHLVNNQLHLNYNLIKEKNLNLNAIKEDCVSFFEQIDGVQWAVDASNPVNASIPTFLKERVIMGYNKERSGAIFLILKSGWVPSSVLTGTEHGNWNPYDAHIPLLWMGKGVKQGKSYAPTRMTDIASTATALLQIQMPSGNIGNPIQELLK